MVKSIDKLLKDALDNLKKLPYFWKFYGLEDKRRFVDSIFTGKIRYDGRDYRMDRLNDALEDMCLKNRKLLSKKKQENEIFFHFPAQVAGSRIELPTSGL